MNREQLTERLQRLWAQATNSCGAAPPQIVAEIREIERELEALDALAAENVLEKPANPAR